MKISIIGSGNVANVMGKLLKKHGFTIEEVISRNKAHAIKLAEELNAVAAINISTISKNSDAYIIAVSDDAIETVSNQLSLNDRIVVHTCGSASINILKNTSKNYGVLYPLQSLRKEINDIPVIPLLIDANNDYTKNNIQQLASAISNNVQEANDDQRMQYHLSAVITSNFSNHLFALAKEYCARNNIDFSLLLPLIKETVNRLHNYDPAQMQTGPAMRNDQSTIQKHLELLRNFPQLKNIYKMMSDSIVASNKK